MHTEPANASLLKTRITNAGRVIANVICLEPVAHLQGTVMEIAIETTVDAPIEDVWAGWVTPDDITRWNFASDDWCCPKQRSIC